MTGDAAAPRRAPVPPFGDLPMADNRTGAYATIRDAGPVIRGPRGRYVIASGEAVEFVLKHPELFSSQRAFDAAGSPLPMVPIAFDPPEHTRYRRILQPFFSPRGTASWLPVVRGLAGELIDGFAGRGECDLVAELAVPLPAHVFLTLFGLPLRDRDRLIAWKEALLNFDFQGSQGGESVPERTVRLGAELYEYLVGHIAQRRRRGGTDDLLGRLLADASDERLSDDEILGLSFLFVLAGLETVTSALSTAFAALAAQPALRRQIAADPAVIPAAVEELLRFDGPIGAQVRIVREAQTLRGRALRPGDRVFLMMNAANRDPRAYPDPDRLDLARDGVPHLTFGFGAHLCLGFPLASPGRRRASHADRARAPDARRDSTDRLPLHPIQLAP